MRYNLSKLMRKAWGLFRKGKLSFSEALSLAWKWIKVQADNAIAIQTAAAAAGFADDEVHTWYGWKSLGRLVMHTEQAVFSVEIADPTTRKGTRINSYFTYDQTQHMPI